MPSPVLPTGALTHTAGSAPSSGKRDVDFKRYSFWRRADGEGRPGKVELLGVEGGRHREQASIWHSKETQGWVPGWWETTQRPEGSAQLLQAGFYG